MQATIYSDNQSIAGEGHLKSSLTSKSSMHTIRTPLSSINRNAQNKHVEKRGILEKRGLLVKTHSSRSLPLMKKQSTSASKITLEASTPPSNAPKTKKGLRIRCFSPKDVRMIFRRKNDVNGSEEFETILQHANPIQVKSKVVIHEDNKDLARTTNLLEQFRITGENLVAHLNKPNENGNKINNGNRSKFLDPPTEDFFSEEMESMLNLQLASPIDESDTESEVSQEFS